VRSFSVEPTAIGLNRADALDDGLILMRSYPSIEQYFYLLSALLLGIVRSLKIQYMPVQIHSADFATVPLAHACDYLQCLQFIQFMLG
jgi:hypothetical protein